VQAAVRIQSLLRGVLAVREALERRAAQVQLRQACRQLLNRWRRRKLTRLRLKVDKLMQASLPLHLRQSHWRFEYSPPVFHGATPRGFQAWKADQPEGYTSRVHGALEKGELLAASASLKCENKLLTSEAAALERVCDELKMSFQQLTRSPVKYFLSQIYLCCTSRESHTMDRRPSISRLPRGGEECLENP
ncbi:unnamed protein product, partial [Polarella glacialis]